MIKNKIYALELLKAKINGERNITYLQISELTGYTKRQLFRYSKEIENKDIESILVNNNVGNPSHNIASNNEINYILNFKNQYPNISIAQFMDFYHEDIIFNKRKYEDIKKYNLKKRSYSFFKNFFHNNNFKSPRRHKCFNYNTNHHPLREPSTRRGILVMIDGTPHDWFENDNKFSLHLALDDATNELLAGWFCPNECLVGYCHMLELLITKYGIPENIYSDKHTILKSPIDDNSTRFGDICEEFGINLIFAESPEAKGKVEKYNDTLQGRLINDIKRNNIKTYQELNIFFNSKYIKYLNHKFSYPAKENKSEFVKLDKKTDLSNIFCIKEERTFLSGCVFSWHNNYYQIIEKEDKVLSLYKGTTIMVMENVFSKVIKVKYNKKIYSTKNIPGHIKSPEKRQEKIYNQKLLEEHLNKLKRDIEE